MIRSVTLINLKPDTTAEQAAAVKAAYLRLPGLIPQLKAMEVGLNAGLLDGAASLAVVADFASREDFGVYSTHAAQGEVVFPVCGPLMTGYSTIQYEKA